MDGLTLYISAAQEMDAECEAVGKLLAGLLPKVRWTLHRTPSGRGSLNPDLRALHASDLHLFLLGADIVAPLGVEWREARHAKTPLFLYRAVGRTMSPAASYFLHHSGAHWTKFRDTADLALKFERQLVAELVAGTPGYGLSLDEIESLTERLEKLPGEASAGETEARGAGLGGVILPKEG